jgi:hypothetical protein
VLRIEPISVVSTKGFNRGRKVIAGLLFLYAIPLFFIAMIVSECAPRVDGFTMAARILLWPLFAVKLLLRVLWAGWKDLLS